MATKRPLSDHLDIHCPPFERHSGESDAESLDLSKDLSFLFKKSAASRSVHTDAETVATTCTDSSFNASFLSSSVVEPLSLSSVSSVPICERDEDDRKTVRFAVDGEDEVLVEAFEAEGPLSEAEKKAMWWQPIEFKLFRRYCKKAAEVARKSDYPDDFTKVYDACSAKHVQDITELCHISRAHVRGLEVVVFPALVQARKLVVKGVVKTQEKLPANMQPDHRQRIISATSRCLTGRARLLARVYGVGDEEVAKDCYYAIDQQEAEREQASGER